jgi:undecaprenyl phosphate-alpha-L-ara4N flippase subunit ArnF
VTTRLSFGNPWVQLAFEAVLVTASEVLLKVGAAETAAPGTAAEWLGLTGLKSAWVWAGIGCLILSFLCWIYVLRHMPLSLAFPLSNIVHVLIPISSWICLGESISFRRWCGIFIVLCGLALVARPVAQLEERL